MSNIIKIPEELRDYLNCEDCSDFNINNYFVTRQAEEIKEDIIRTKEKADIIQNIMGKSYPNTTLLFGPPGTGKTTLARYLAYSLQMPFVYVNFAKIFNGIFGRTTSIISDIFDFIKDKECIFMLDEIDCVSQKRGTEAASTGGELSRVTVVLMQSLDMLRAVHSNVIVLGATNRNDIMDPALRSRFSIKKELQNLNSSEKEQYIIKFLEEINQNLAKSSISCISYDIKNIKEYCTRGSRISQRNVEMDIMRCLAKWLDDTSSAFVLDHIQEEWSR